MLAAIIVCGFGRSVGLFPATHSTITSRFSDQAWLLC